MSPVRTLPMARASSHVRRREGAYEKIPAIGGDDGDAHQRRLKVADSIEGDGDGTPHPRRTLGGRTAGKPSQLGAMEDWSVPPDNALGGASMMAVTAGNLIRPASPKGLPVRRRARQRTMR
jgi:hypothetical protein